MQRLMKLRLFYPIIILCITCLAPGAAAQAGYPPTIVFMTDFGVVDDSVNICKGVMYSISPRARIVDLTHEVTPFSIRDGARLLADTADHYLAASTTLFDTLIGVLDVLEPVLHEAVLSLERRSEHEAA